MRFDSHKHQKPFEFLGKYRNIFGLRKHLEFKPFMVIPFIRAWYSFRGLFLKKWFQLNADSKDSPFISAQNEINELWSISLWLQINEKNQFVTPCCSCI